MQALVDFFKSIVETISTFLDFFWTSLTDSVYIVRLSMQFISDIPSYFSWIPMEIYAILAVTISIFLILRIIGRDN